MESSEDIVLEDNLIWNVFQEMGEPFTDKYLQRLMLKPPTTSNLKNILGILNYKVKYCIKYNREINNTALFEFSIKLLLNDTVKDNISIISEIFEKVLLLQLSTLSSKAEHLLQQILTDEFIDENSDNEKLLFYLHIVDSVLKAAQESKVYLNLQYYFASLEKLAFHNDQKIQQYFLNSVVPKFIQVVGGYDILARIWESVDDSRDIYITLSTLNYLSFYFIPTESSYLFDIIQEPTFWRVLIDGLHTQDSTNKKLCIGLLKSVLNACKLRDKGFEVLLKNQVVFYWHFSNSNFIKDMWKNYFILIETLDEKQSNIVFPCLNLYKNIQKISKPWSNYAYQLGLTHSNFRVRCDSLLIRLKYPITDCFEAKIILMALNEERLYRSARFRSNILETLSSEANIVNVYEMLTSVQWLATPLYYMSEMLANIKPEAVRTFKTFDGNKIIELLSLPCNRVPIRLAIKNNLLTFLCKMFGDWKSFFLILGKLNIDLEEGKPGFRELEEVFKRMKVLEKEKKELACCLMNRTSFANVVKLYLNIYPNDVGYFVQVLKSKLEEDAYLIDDLAFMGSFLKEKLESESSKAMKALIKDKFDNIAENIQGIITARNVEFTNIYENFDKICCIFIQEFGVHESFVKIAWNENNPIEFKIKHLILIKSLVKVTGHVEMDLGFLLDCKGYAKKGGNDLKSQYNKMYEVACEIIYLLMPVDVKNEDFIRRIPAFLAHALDCGGYGCLKWILQAMVTFVNTEHDFGVSYMDLCKEFDLVNFIDTAWTEVMALKSNKQFIPCMREFVNLITSEVLLKNDEYKRRIVSYGMEILRLTTTSIGPISLLVTRFKRLRLTIDSVWIPTFIEFLLYRPVITEDQRYQNLLIQELPDYFRNNDEMREEPLFPNELRNASAAILPLVQDNASLFKILTQMFDYMMTSLKAKPRYHQNSLTHQTYLQILMHTTFIMKLTSKHCEIYNFIFKNSVEMLTFSHQRDVRFYLEWILTLCLLKLHKNLPEDIFSNDETLGRVPEISCLSISYFYLKARQNLNDFNVIINHMLPYTMGPSFTLRLLAQYLISEMFKLFKKNNNVTHLEFTVKTIDKVLKSMNDNIHFKELKNSILIRNFEPVGCLDAEFIYYVIPKTFSNDNQSKKYLMKKTDLYELLKKYDRVDVDFESDFHNYWPDIPMEVYDEDWKTSTVEEMMAFQKKYVPGEDTGLEPIEKSGMVVVASLVDKLPNLGGMARTCEVFGVKNLIVHSLKQINSKEFQGTSMSAEKLVEVKEVAFGKPLIAYLKSMRMKGYTIVAAEQTSISINLNTFTFPKKTVLVTGHEKEGLPTNLFPYVDVFVRIPQQGYTRSLNVHVTASIFIWEYVKQHTGVTKL